MPLVLMDNSNSSPNTSNNILIEFIKNNMKKKWHKSGVYRVDKPDYDLEAVREALVNALIPCVKGTSTETIVTGKDMFSYVLEIIENKPFIFHFI